MWLALAACAPAPPPGVEVREVPGGIEVVAPAALRWVDVRTIDAVPVLERAVEPPADRVALPARPPRAAVWQVRAERTDGRIEVAQLEGPAFPVALALEVAGQRWPLWDEQAVAFWSGAPATLRLEARRRATVEVTVDRFTTTLPLAEAGAVVEAPLALEHEAEVLVQVGAAHVELELAARPPDPTPPRIVGVRFPVDARGRPDADGALAAVEVAQRAEEPLAVVVRAGEAVALARLGPAGRATVLVPARAGDRIELVPLGAAGPVDRAEVSPPAPAPPRGAPPGTPSPGG